MSIEGSQTMPMPSLMTGTMQGMMTSIASSGPASDSLPAEAPVPVHPTKTSESKSHTRSRLGCYTCRLRRKKCNEAHPSCSACTGLRLKCEYKRPGWWVNAEQRRIQKDRIKEKIRETKVMEKDGSLQEYMDRIRALSHQASPFSPGFNFNSPVFPRQPGPAALPTPTSQYEVVVENDHWTNMGTQQRLSVSTLSPMGPPLVPSATPISPAQGSANSSEPSRTISPVFSGEMDVPLSYHVQAAVPMDERDRPLIEHFVDNVLGFVFPIIEIHQQGPARAREVLFSLETNKTYFHCCLSVSAIHLKTSMGLSTTQIDHDIMRHRYEAVSQLCQDLAGGNDHMQTLDATLAMIFFHCSVSAPNDYLPDIPWHDHLKAASSLVNKLDGSPRPFSVALIAWIDILGATMLGTMPHFAHTYRSRHLHGTSSGLRELMGCDDRVMYLISEIACLDALRSQGRVDDVALCQHVGALSTQLERTEPADSAIVAPYSPSGTMQPHQLTNNITAVFRIAARIYLYSLLPGFDCHQPSNINMVKSVAEILPHIPSGPYGFDRCLVWPLLITGACSVASSPFRRILTERAAFLGDGDFGSFGKMFGLLMEVWSLADDPIPSPLVESIPVRSSSPSLGTPGRSLRKRHVHWREVMRRKGWRYLLM